MRALLSGACLTRAWKSISGKCLSGSGIASAGFIEAPTVDLKLRVTSLGLAPMNTREPEKSGARETFLARVLVIENQPDHLEWVRSALQSTGIVVLEARDALAGLQYAVEATPDLVLVSTSLPGLDGFDVTARILSDPEACDLPVTMLTDRIDRTVREAAASVGAQAIFDRSWDRVTLLEAVRRQLLAAGIQGIWTEPSEGPASGTRPA